MRAQLKVKQSTLANLSSDLRSRIAGAAMKAMSLLAAAAPAPGAAAVAAAPAATAAAAPAPAAAAAAPSAADLFVRRMELTQQLLASGFDPAAAGRTLEAEVAAQLAAQDAAAAQQVAAAAAQQAAAQPTPGAASFGALGGDMFSGYMGN